MKVRIKREQLKKWEVIASSVEFGKAQRFFFLPEEIELEISESDIVKEKTNREKWDEILNKIYQEKHLKECYTKENVLENLAFFLDFQKINATQAYEKIVEGK